MARILVSYERENSFPDWATPRVLKAMHDDGKSLRELAKQFGVSYQTIANKIKQAVQTQPDTVIATGAKE